MLRHLLATTAILLALGAPVFAEEPAAGTENQATTATDTAVTGKTPAGGVTATAKEIIPETSSEDGAGDEAAIDPEEYDSTGAPTMDQAARSGTAGSGVVSQEVLRELRAMALEAEKKAATPPVTKTDEEITAERQAIERHRKGLFERAGQES